jgi:hypothetical protein
MCYELQLGLQKTKVERTPKATEVLFVKIGDALVPSRKPDIADDTGKAFEQQSKIDFPPRLLLNCI